MGKQQVPAASQPFLKSRMGILVILAVFYLVGATDKSPWQAANLPTLISWSRLSLPFF